MEEAVAEAKDSLVHTKLTPSSIELVQGAANIKSLMTPTCLEKVKLFTEFVDGIAGVSGRADELSAVSDSRGDRISRSTHMLTWRGASSLLCLRFVLRKLYIFILMRTSQTILARVDHDSCIVRLVEIMDDVLSFVKEAEPIKKIKSHGLIIELMSRQATECAYFIRDYAMNKSLCRSSPTLHI